MLQLMLSNFVNILILTIAANVIVSLYVYYIFVMLTPTI